jgi:hypothetical protein
MSEDLEHVGNRLKRLWIRLVRAWRSAGRTQRNVSAARREALRTRDNEYERISSIGRYPPR